MSSPLVHVRSANKPSAGSNRRIADRVRRHQVDFWLDRHKSLAGDIRAVGNRGLSVAENEAIYADASADLTKALDDTLSPLAGRSLIDLGCGVGLYAGTVIDAGMNYVGIDASSLALEQARRRCPKGVFRQANVTFYRSRERFDAALLATVLCHLVDDRLFDAALDTTRNLLKPGGIVFIFDHFPEVEATYRDYVCNRAFADFANRLRAVGLEIERRPAQREFYLARVADT